MAEIKVILAILTLLYTFYQYNLFNKSFRKHDFTLEYVKKLMYFTLVFEFYLKNRSKNVKKLVFPNFDHFPAIFSKHLPNSKL